MSDRDLGEIFKLKLADFWRTPEKMEQNLDWNNDTLFFTYSWWDETSKFDTHPSIRWNYGGECYERQYSARVPLAFKGNDSMIHWFIELMDNHSEESGFWVD